MVGIGVRYVIVMMVAAVSSAVIEQVLCLRAGDRE